MVRARGDGAPRVEQCILNPFSVAECLAFVFEATNLMPRLRLPSPQLSSARHRHLLLDVDPEGTSMLHVFPSLHQAARKSEHAHEFVLSSCEHISNVNLGSRSASDVWATSSTRTVARRSTPPPFDASS